MQFARFVLLVCRPTQRGCLLQVGQARPASHALARRRLRLLLRLRLRLRLLSWSKWRQQVLQQVKFNFELRKRTNGLVVFCPFQHPTTSPVISDISHSRFNVQPCHSDISHSSSAAGARTSRRARRVYVLFRVAFLCYVSPLRSFCLMLPAVGPMKLCGTQSNGCC